MTLRAKLMEGRYTGRSVTGVLKEKCHFGVQFRISPHTNAYVQG